MKIKNSGLICFLIWLGFISCTSAPKLSKEQYSDIILDLQVAETIIVGHAAGINKDSLRRAVHLRIAEIYGFKDIWALKSVLEPLETKPELMLEITKLISQKLDRLADSAITSPQ